MELTEASNGARERLASHAPTDLVRSEENSFAVFQPMLRLIDEREMRYLRDQGFRQNGLRRRRTALYWRYVMDLYRATNTVCAEAMHAADVDRLDIAGAVGLTLGMWGSIALLAACGLMYRLEIGQPLRIAAASFRGIEETFSLRQSRLSDLAHRAQGV